MSDSEDEVSASSDTKAWAPTLRMRFLPHPTPRRGLQLIRFHGEGSALSDPRGSDSVSPGSQGAISASPDPWGSDLLPDQSSGPRVGLEPLQPLQHRSARLGARLGRVLMRLAVASGHAGKLTSPPTTMNQKVLLKIKLLASCRERSHLNMTHPHDMPF